jgi:LuxR family maltose regulon positive regulatory protein
MNRSRLAWFHVQRGLTFSLLDDEISASRAYRRAWEFGTGSGVAFVQSQAAANLALNCALLGDAAQTTEWLARYKSFDTSDWPGNYLIGLGAHIAAGLLALDRLEDDGVHAELQHLGDGSAPLELWPFIAFLFAQHALHSGRANEALTHLDQLQAANQEAGRPVTGAAAVLMSRARADLAIACGHGERARQLLKKQGAGTPWNRVPTARIRLLGGYGAIVKVDPLTWDPATSTRDRLEMLLLSAVGSLRCEDSHNARRFMHQALELYDETGILRPFATIQAADLAQLVELADRDIGPDASAILAQHSPVYPDRLLLVDLSEHERWVLEALAKTGSRQEMADSLLVSVNTIKTQLASLYEKLGTSTRSETLLQARELELLPPDPE